MCAALTHAGVDTNLTTRDERPSPLSLVSRGSETTSARYRIYLDGTAHAPPGLSTDWLKGAAHLHVSSFSAIAGAWGEAVEAALHAAKGSISASFDINIRPALIPPREESRKLIERRIAEVGLVKASDEDLAWLFPDRDPRAAAADWAQRFSFIVLLTQGAAGATAFRGDKFIHRPGRKIDVADTIGAGDSFVAAFLARAQETRQIGALASADLGALLDYANAAAALCCSRAGADPATSAEIRAALKAS
jgi:fructokinase